VCGKSCHSDHSVNVFKYCSIIFHTISAELVNSRTFRDFWVTVALVKPTQKLPSISCAGAAELGNTRDDPRLQSISMSQAAVASVLIETY
jgi:hypothetical protein